ncbi:MAG TPA: hypothetical protein VMI54_26765 [Polyangiaceae bacterium]|nr:hypothetical protein [Polyangiaceae bacterium]
MTRGLALLAVLFAGACHAAPEAPAVHARFGVFFGGQIEERDEIPLVLDRARQSLGIRLEFAAAPTAPERVSWELEKPRATKTGASLGSIVDYGEARTRPGEPVLDVPLAFREGDRPGAWRVRVALDGKNVLDRGFKVIPASEAPSEN